MLTALLRYGHKRVVAMDATFGVNDLKVGICLFSAAVAKAIDNSCGNVQTARS